MQKLLFQQISKDNEELCKVAQELCVPYFEELNDHDGIVESKEDLLNATNARIAIQGKRKDMHFEIAFLNNIAIGIAMFAIDSGTVHGLLKSGYGTVLELYIKPEYRRMGLGKDFFHHIPYKVLRSNLPDRSRHLCQPYREYSDKGHHC